MLRITHGLEGIQAGAGLTAWASIHSQSDIQKPRVPSV